MIKHVIDNLREINRCFIAYKVAQGCAVKIGNYLVCVVETIDAALVILDQRRRQPFSCRFTEMVAGSALRAGSIPVPQH